MTDISFREYASMSDKALAEHIGAYVKHHRLEQNKTQDILSYEAGISRSTLSLLERGETVTVATLIQVLRVLDQLDAFSAFEVRETFSPLALAKLPPIASRLSPTASRLSTKFQRLFHLTNYTRSAFLITIKRLIICGSAACEKKQSRQDAKALRLKT